MTKMKCEKCGKDFYYLDTGNPYPGGKDREYIHCPYCNFINGSIIISGIVRSYKNKKDIDLF